MPNDTVQTTHVKFEKQQYYGFKSENSPPVIKELIRFEEELYKLSRNIKFRKIYNNKLQDLIRQSIRNIKASKNVIVPADKSHLMYQIPIPVYRKLLSNAVTDTYKISSQKKVATVNKDTLYLLEKCEPGLESRVEVFTQAEAVVTIKDQKSSFPSQIEVRLINPAKPQLGKITKVKLQDMNFEKGVRRNLTNFNLQMTQYHGSTN